MGTRLDRLQLSSLLSWMGMVRDDDDGAEEAAAAAMLASASADWRAARREASASRR